MENMNKRYKPETQNINPRANIAEGCVIHSHVWIGDDVTIGRGCKIQAFAFIPNGVRLADNVFVGPHVVFTNDKVPRANGAWEQKNTFVGEGSAIGANATILPGVRIGKEVTVGAGAVVTKNIPDGETWVGNPAKKL